MRPSLRSRADDVGLDTDGPGWVCELHALGEISSDERAGITAGWERSSDEEQEPEVDTAAPPAP